MDLTNEIPVWTDAEGVNRILNCQPSRETGDDWGIDNALKAGILRRVTEDDIPDEKDLRQGCENWWHIVDQGETGSCVGWAAEAVLRWHFIKAKHLHTNEVLSARYLWMASKETDTLTARPTTFLERAGTNIKAVLDIAYRYGVVRDKDLPFQVFENGILCCMDQKTFYTQAAQLRIAAYINLGKKLSDWRRWLATQGPILTRLNIDNTWRTAKQNNGNLDDYDVASREGGHAVALVGYTPDRFIVRNSWGTENWGKEGYGFASNDYTRKAFTEAYGVEVY